jgi:hypothetical protein
MSPVHNVSAPLADVMRRAEERGARQERERLLRRARAMHEASHSGSTFAGFQGCREPACQALAQLLAEAADLSTTQTRAADEAPADEAAFSPPA